MLRAKGTAGEYHVNLTIPPRTAIILKEGKPMASASGEKKAAEKKPAARQTKKAEKAE